MKKLLLTLMGLVSIFAVQAQNPTLYLRGAVNNWGTSNQFTESNGVYTLTLPSLSGEFKIADANWGSYNFGAGNSADVSLDTNYTLVQGSSTNLKPAGGVTWTNVTLTFTLSSKILRVTGASQENQYSEVYLVGDFGSGWSESITTYPLKLKSGTTNTYEGTYNFSNGTNYFKMKAGTLVYGTGGDDISIVIGTEYTASQSGNAFVVGSGEFTFSFVLNKNAATGKLTVTGTGQTVEPTQDIWVNLNGAFHEGDNGVQPNAQGMASWTNQAIGADPVYIKIWDGADKFLYSKNPVALDTWTALEYTNDWTPTSIQGQTSNSVYNVEYNINTNEIKFTLVSGGDTPVDPTPSTKENLYVVGAANGWNLETAVKMDHEEGTNVWTITSDKMFADEWKITDGTWDWTFGMGDNLDPNVNNDCWFDGQNFKAISGNVTLKFTLVNGSDVKGSSTPSTVYFTVEGGDTPVDPTPSTKENLYVVGAANGWNLETAVKMDHEEGTNVWTITSDTMFADEWKITDGTWDWTFGMGDNLDPNVNNDCWFDGQNFKAISGNVTLKFTLVSGSDVKGSSTPSTVYFTVEGGDTPVDPTPGDDYANWWVNVGGPFNEYNFYEGGQQPVELVATFTDLAIGTGGFKVKTWDNVKDTYYITDGSAVTPDQWTQLYVDEEDGAYVQIANATSESVYTVKFNVKTNQVLVVAKTTGVAGIEAADADAVYYNLQGQKVANPDKGIYIKVLNGKAVKVVK